MGVPNGTLSDCWDSLSDFRRQQRPTPFEAGLHKEGVLRIKRLYLAAHGFQIGA